MERLKRWMLAGVLIGGLAATAVHARQPQSGPPQRLVVVASDHVSGEVIRAVLNMNRCC